MTQKQVAEHLNISASGLSSYIQNVREPDYEILKNFANYFNVTTDYLLNHKTDQNMSDKEDELLRIFRSLTTDQQELFIKQGKLLIAHHTKKD